MVNQKYYEEAMRNPFIRQQFIHSIDLESARFFIGDIAYRETDMFHRLSLPLMMRCVAPVRTLVGKNWGKSKIGIYPEAFSPEIHPRLDDFLSSLIDHEGHHARMLYENPNESRVKVGELFLGLVTYLWSPQKFEDVKKKHIAIEQRCIWNQLNNFQRRNCSDQYKKRVEERHQYYSKILSKNIDNDLIII